MQISFPKAIWFVVALVIAWQINNWQASAKLASYEAARAGDRKQAEIWIERELDDSECELHEANEYLTASTREYVVRPDFVQGFVGDLYKGGALNVQICDVKVVSLRLAEYLLVTLPVDPDSQEGVIADAQSFTRRNLVTYEGYDSSRVDEIEELVKDSTMVGQTRVLIDLPTEEAGE